MMKYILLFLSISFISKSQTKDSLSLKDAFSQGKILGSFRQFSMYNNYYAVNSIYHGIAIGGAIRYETATWHHLKFRMGSSIVYDLSSSNFSTVEPFSKAPERYAIGLYDVTDFSHKNELVRIEDLNLNYQNSFANLTFGKQLLTIPFINPQDGRMRPSLMEGLWTQFQVSPTAQLSAGYLYAASPRSTQKWFSIDQAIGYYPMGVGIDGKKANYLNNLQSKGLFIAGFTQTFGKNQKLKLWNIYLDNILNLSFVQFDGENRMSSTSKFVYGIQASKENAVNDGGNANPSKTYYAKGTKAWVFSGRIGIAQKKSQFLLNYSRITADGRFQFPREFGIEPFYTFLARERNEGLGDVHAFTSSYASPVFTKALTLQVSAGYYKLPDVKNARLNKYGFPTYWQGNIDLKYRFTEKWEGLTIQFLYVQKWNAGNTYADFKYLMNKVEMSQYNLVLNYNFGKS